MRRIEVFGLVRPGQVYDVEDDRVEGFIEGLQAADRDFFEVLRCDACRGTDFDRWPEDPSWLECRTCAHVCNHPHGVNAKVREASQ